MSEVTTTMNEAGVAAALQILPGDVFRDRGIDPTEFVTRVFSAMASNLWRPIDTAPKSTEDSIMLGVVDETGFSQGIGRWVSPDDDNPGMWSTQSWWGKPPTHWMPMPAPPPKAVS